MSSTYASCQTCEYKVCERVTYPFHGRLSYVSFEQVDNLMHGVVVRNSQLQSDAQLVWSYCRKSAGILLIGLEIDLTEEGGAWQLAVPLHVWHSSAAGCARSNNDFDALANSFLGGFACCCLDCYAPT